MSINLTCIHGKLVSVIYLYFEFYTIDTMILFVFVFVAAQAPFRIIFRTDEDEVTTSITSTESAATGDYVVIDTVTTTNYITTDASTNERFGSRSGTTGFSLSYFQGACENK